MRTLNEHDNKIMVFLTQLSNAYRDEEEIEYVSKLDFKEEELTDDFIAMLQALQINYERITGDEVDLLGFTHILNRLAFQYLLENNVKPED